MVPRLADIVVNRPRAVLAIWAVGVALLASLGALTGGHLSPTHLTVPGLGADRAGQISEQHFGRSSTEVVVLLEGPGPVLSRDGPRITRALRALPETAVRSPWDPEAPKTTRPGPGSAVLVVSFPAADRSHLKAGARRVRHAVSAAGTGSGLVARYSGAGIIGAALEESALESVSHAELIALPVLVLVLLLVFRSLVAAAIPLATGAASVIAANGLVGLISLVADVDVFAVTLASMMGLALGVDYSLLLVSRFRSELCDGCAANDAARRTMMSAGRTVLFAGVVLSAAMLAALAIAPGGILFSTVVGALAAATVSAAGAVVAVPAALALLGHRINRRVSGSARAARLVPYTRPVAKRPALAAVIVGGLLLVLAAPALDLRTGPPDATQLPPSNSARADHEAVAQAVGAGRATPFVIVAAAREATLADTADRRALGAWRRDLLRDTDAEGVDIEISPDRRAARLTVAAPGGPNTRASRELRDTLAKRAAGLSRALDAEVAVGGQPAEFDEFLDALAARAPWLIAAVTLTTALVLLVVFRSLLLPVVAIALNLLAVAAAFGALTLLFAGSAPLGGPGFIDAVSIVAAYTVVFGLSIDYQVFLLARMREIWLRTRDHERAVSEGLRETASVVTGAAAIMVAVFAAFALAQMAAVRQLGTALAVAVIVDATLVRLLLLPAIMRLIGPAAWWLPRRFERALPRLDGEWAAKRARTTSA